MFGVLWSANDEWQFDHIVSSEVSLFLNCLPLFDGCSRLVHVCFIVVLSTSTRLFAHLMNSKFKRKLNLLLLAIHVDVMHALLNHFLFGLHAVNLCFCLSICHIFNNLK